MKRFLFLFVLLCNLPLFAAEYVGTMVVGESYTLNDIRVSLDEQGNLMLYNVKFARLMPVRVDVLIPAITRAKGSPDTLSGENIIPRVSGKDYPSRIATKLKGTVSDKSLRFSCLFGGKPLQFSGEATRQ